MAAVLSRNPSRWTQGPVLLDRGQEFPICRAELLVIGPLCSKRREAALWIIPRFSATAGPPTIKNLIFCGAKRSLFLNVPLDLVFSYLSLSLFVAAAVCSLRASPPQFLYYSPLPTTHYAEPTKHLRLFRTAHCRRSQERSIGQPFCDQQRLYQWSTPSIYRRR